MLYEQGAHSPTSSTERRRRVSTNEGYEGESEIEVVIPSMTGEWEEYWNCCQCGGFINNTSSMCCSEVSGGTVCGHAKCDRCELERDSVGRTGT